MAARYGRAEPDDLRRVGSDGRCHWQGNAAQGAHGYVVGPPFDSAARRCAETRHRPSEPAREFFEASPGCSTERGFDRNSGASQATGRYWIRRYGYVLVGKRHQPNPRIRLEPRKLQGQRMGRRQDKSLGNPCLWRRR